MAGYITSTVQPVQVSKEIGSEQIPNSTIAALGKMAGSEDSRYKFAGQCVRMMLPHVANWVRDLITQTACLLPHKLSSICCGKGAYCALTIHCTYCSNYSKWNRYGLCNLHAINSCTDSMPRAQQHLPFPHFNDTDHLCWSSASPAFCCCIPANQ